MKHKFNRGDIVSFKPYMNSGSGHGEIVTLPGEKYSGASYGIKIIEEKGRQSDLKCHNLHGSIAEAKGWFFPPDLLELHNIELPYDPTQMGDREEDI